jgi:hypothetical protein
VKENELKRDYRMLKDARQQSGVGWRRRRRRKTKKSCRHGRSAKIKTKRSGEALVRVMDGFVNIKEKEANNEAAQQFTITKCIAALRTLGRV